MFVRSAYLTLDCAPRLLAMSLRSAKRELGIWNGTPHAMDLSFLNQQNVTTYKFAYILGSDHL